MTIKTSETAVIKRSQINLNPLNPKRHTEEADYDLIAKYIGDMDFHSVGLSESDINSILSFTNTEIESVTDSIDDLILPPPAEEEYLKPIEKTAEEKKRHVKDIKEQVRESAEKRHADEEAYIMLSFTNAENKQSFCDLFGIDISDKFMKGERLLEMMD